jgi:hypothetical protein
VVNPSQDLVDQLYRQQILLARRIPPEEKLLDGLRLFERSCGLMADGIRAELPEADGQQVREILIRRISRLRQIDEYGLYKPFEDRPS